MHERYASAWEQEEHQRRLLVWERSTLGAALTLGKRPVAYPRSRFAEDNELPTVESPPPPLTTIPEITTSNWSVIVDEVLDHYGLSLISITGKFGRDRWHVACAQEMAYRLMTYGRRFGRPLSSNDVAQIMKRDHSTILYSRKMHALRLQRLQAEAVA